MIPQTGVAIVDWFLSLLDAWGYLVVAGFTIFENLFILGSLTPGETVVIAASALAARKLLLIWGVWLASMAGTLIGSNITYWLGRRAGMDSVRTVVVAVSRSRAGRLMRIGESGLDEIHDHFHTDGAKTVLLARFAIGAKNFVPAVAGATRMPLFWFELYTVIGALMYTTLMCVVGWFVGRNFDRALAIVKNVSLAGLGVFLLFVASAIYARRRIKAKKAAEEATREPVDELAEELAENVADESSPEQSL